MNKTRINQLLFRNHLFCNSNLSLTINEQIGFYLSFLWLPLIINLTVFLLKEFNIKPSILIINNPLNQYFGYQTLFTLLFFIYLLIYKRKLLWKEKLLALFLWLPFQRLIRILFSITFRSFGPDFNIILNLVFLWIYNGIMVFFIFWHNHTLKAMLKKAGNHIGLFFVILGVGFVFYILTNTIISQLNSFIDPAIPQNQRNINNYYQTIFGIINLFLSSLIFAPLIEEFNCRYLFAQSGNNSWKAYFFQTVFFAFLHIQNSYDWKHFLVYLPLGLIGGLIYKLYQNITITISLHLIINLIAFIVNLPK